MKHQIIADGRQLVLLTSPDERDVLSMFAHPEQLTMDRVKISLDPLLGMNGLEWAQRDNELVIYQIGEPKPAAACEDGEYVYLGRWPDTDGQLKKWFARITSQWKFCGSHLELWLQLRDQGQAILTGGSQ